MAAQVQNAQGCETLPGCAEERWVQAQATGLPARRLRSLSSMSRAPGGSKERFASPPLTVITGTRGTNGGVPTRACRPQRWPGFPSGKG